MRERGLDSSPAPQRAGIAGLISALALLAILLAPAWRETLEQPQPSAAIISAAFGLLCWRLAKESGRLLVPVAVTLLAALAASPEWMEGPRLFSCLLLVPWHEAVRQRRLGVLALMSVAWANLDGTGFVGGLLVLALYTVAGREVGMVVAVALCAALSGLNAEGYRLLSVGWESLWAGPTMNFQLPEARGFLVWLGLMFVGLAWRRPRLPVGEGLVLVCWVALALYSRDNIPFMVVLTAPVLAMTLREER